MSRDVAYVRVSDKRHQADRFSLPAQRQQIAAWCALHGRPEPTWYTDAHTAKDDDPDARPTFRQLLADAKAGRIDTLIVVDIDRFARSVLAGLDAAARLERAGVRLVSLNDGDVDTATPDGEFNFTLKLMLARRENRVRGRKSKAGTLAAQAAGRYTSRPPYGARIGADGCLELDPATAPILERILREAATHPDGAIAARLTAEGVPNPGSRWGSRWPNQSGAWLPDTIRGFVTRGHWLADFPDPWPTLWLAARDRPRQPHTRRDTRTHMLTGLVRCPCGTRLFHSGKTTRPVAYFSCRNYRRGGRGYGCPHKRRNVERYEAVIAAAIAGLTFAPTAHATGAPRDTEALDALDRERKALAFQHRQGFIRDAELVAAMAELDQRRRALPPGEAQVIALGEELAVIVPRFGRLLPAEQNRVLSLLVAEILIEHDRLTIAWRTVARALFGVPESTQYVVR